MTPSPSPSPVLGQFRKSQKIISFCQETKTLRCFFIFLEMKLSYISGNGNPRKLLMFQEVTFRACKKNPTLKKFLIFR